MKRKADQLIATVDDLLIAEAAGHRQRQIILFWFIDQVKHPFKQVSDLTRLTIEALGKQHRELGGVHLQHATDHGGIHALRTRCDQGVAFLHEGAGHQLNQMNRHHRDVTATKNRDPPLSLVLQQGQLLRERIDPIKGWEIQRLTQSLPIGHLWKLAALNQNEP